MSVEIIKTKKAPARLPIPAGASVTSVVAKYYPQRYLEDLRERQRLDPNRVNLEAEFAMFADEAMDWAETTLQTPDSWPKI